MMFELHDGGRVSGNREVSRGSQRAERAVSWKKGFVGEHGFHHATEPKAKEAT